jgi:molecular chaperone GrpE
MDRHYLVHGKIFDRDGLGKSIGILNDMKKKDKEKKETTAKQRVAEAEEVENIDEGTDKLQESLKKISELENKLAESNDKFLRLFSEFDNYRKRTAKERIELSKLATADIITAMLPVLDDLERACTLGGTQTETDPVFEGFVLILNKFKSILRQKGVEEIPTIGVNFDTDLHEAITHIPASEAEQKGRVMEATQKGYTLNGKVIRFAKVIVAN